MALEYSVLMLVYAGADPAEFDLCLESMMNQTRPTSDFVLVCDGKLTAELDRIVEKYDTAYPGVFNIVRLQEHVGIGPAAQKGLLQCKKDYVVRMDSDDISFPYRCETEMAEFEKDPALDMVGGYIQERDPDGNTFEREVPLEHEDILHFGKRRFPFNNVTIAFRKSKAIEIGGYGNYQRCEDYEFVFKMLSCGAKTKNIAVPLVLCTLDEDSYKRRKSWTNTSSNIIVRRHMWKSGFCSFFDYIIPSAAQLGMYILPSGFTKMLYTKYLRKKG